MDYDTLFKNLKLLEMKYEKEKKLNWVIYYKNLANYEASHPKMSSSIKSIRLMYIYVQHEKSQNFYTLKLARPVANF